MKNNIRVHVVITGKVQGVCFRMETKKAAERYGVFGWARNVIDGSVEAVFEGDEEKVNLILKWCKKGASQSTVKKVDVSWEEYNNEFLGFEIRY